jgi:methylenetetrahydrofolate reductase (NADPH)
VSLPLHRLGAHRATLAAVLRDVSYEVLPFKSVEELVVSHVPTDVRITVTTTEAKGLEPTLALAERLAGQGYRAAPHIAARLVRDTEHLKDIVARLDSAGVYGIFVIGGDAPSPAGSFEDAVLLLEALESMGHHFKRIGIGGYPEGHGHISPDVMERALAVKSQYATHVLTQLCFDADTIDTWSRKLKRDDVAIPIMVGMPGAVSREKLIRISASLGLGQSARFLQKQGSMFRRFFLPGGYSPDKLIQQLAPSFAAEDNNLQGLHLFTFNAVKETEAWRQKWLERLA